MVYHYGYTYKIINSSNQVTLTLKNREKVGGFWLYISLAEGSSLSPECPQLGDNGGAHGTTPVKPYKATVEIRQLT